MSNTDFEEAPDGTQPQPPEVDEEIPPGTGEEGAEEAADDPDATGTEADADGPGVDEGVEPPPRRSRAEQRIQALRQTVETEKAERQRLERDLAEVRQQVSRSRQESPDEEAARMALMTSEERLDYKLAKAERNHAQSTQALQFQMADTTDKATFKGMVRADPYFARYETPVETELAALRRRGLNVGREEILHNIIGREALARRSKVPAAKRAGQAAIRRQTTPAANGRTDVATQRGRSTDTPAKRLDGVLI